MLRYLWMLSSLFFYKPIINEIGVRKITHHFSKSAIMTNVFYALNKE